MAKKYFLLTLILLMLILCISCGQSPEDERKDAVLSANIMLSSRQCQAAIDLLESVGRDSNDGKYMQTLASAYACLAGYAEPSFFINDLPKLGTPSGLGALARFALSSSMRAPNASSFVNLQKAIDVLLYAGGVDASSEPTVALRGTGLSSYDAQDVNSQLLYLLLTQLGLYINYYGNSSAAGVKGGGTQGNTCFLNYSGAVTLPGIASTLTAYFGTNVTGACTAASLGNTGHPNLGLDSTSLNVTRMCQGVVLLNSFLDIFPSVIASITSNDLSALGALSTVVPAAKTAVLAAKPGAAMTTLLSTLNQANCVANNTAETEYLQVYFAFMFEGLFQ